MTNATHCLGVLITYNSGAKEEHFANFTAKSHSSGLGGYRISLSSIFNYSQTETDDHNHDYRTNYTNVRKLSISDHSHKFKSDAEVEVLP